MRFKNNLSCQPIYLGHPALNFENYVWRIGRIEPFSSQIERVDSPAFTINNQRAVIASTQGLYHQPVIAAAFNRKAAWIAHVRAFDPLPLWELDQ